MPAQQNVENKKKVEERAISKFSKELLETCKRSKTLPDVTKFDESTLLFIEKHTLLKHHEELDKRLIQLGKLPKPGSKLEQFEPEPLYMVHHHNGSPKGRL